MGQSKSPMNYTAFIIAGALVLSSGCSSTDITYDYDPSANFEALQTYAWSPGEVAGDVSSFTIDRVKNITNQAMQVKGYRESPNPDFLISLHGGLTAVHTSGWGWSGLESSRFEEGALILHIYDAGTRRIIWSGAASGEAGPQLAPEEEARELTEVINTLLAGFPPK